MSAGAPNIGDWYSDDEWKRREVAIRLAFLAHPLGDHPDAPTLQAEVAWLLMQPAPFAGPEGQELAARLVAGLARMDAAPEDDLPAPLWWLREQGRRFLTHHGVLLADDPNVNDNSK